MNSLLEIIHITLLTIGKSIFNFSFLFIIWIIYRLINQYKMINIYNYESAKSNTTTLVESILQGIIIGIVGSLVITLIGLPINLTGYILLLLPIALLLSLINVRYLCFSYAASIMGILSLTLNGQQLFGIRLPSIDLNISGLLAIVGVLHLMESILIYLVGADDSIPIVAKKNDEVILGHMMQKFWPIPIAMLILSSGTASGEIPMPHWWPLLKDIPKGFENYYYVLMPIVGALGYNGMTFSEEPEKRSKKTAIMLFIYSLILIVISIASVDRLIVQIIGTMIMAGMHEGIIKYEQYIESVKKPIYTLPEKGARVMSIETDGPGDIMGLKVGDVVIKLNDIEIININHLKSLLLNNYTFIWLEVVGIDNKVRNLEYKAYPNGVNNIKVKFLPENPRIVYKYNNMNKLGLIHIIMNKIKK